MASCTSVCSRASFFDRLQGESVCLSTPDDKACHFALRGEGASKFGCVNFDCLAGKYYVDSDGSDNEAYNRIVVFLRDMLKCFCKSFDTNLNENQLRQN